MNGKIWRKCIQFINWKWTKPNQSDRIPSTVSALEKKNASFIVIIIRERRRRRRKSLIHEKFRRSTILNRIETNAEYDPRFQTKAQQTPDRWLFFRIFNFWGILFAPLLFQRIFVNASLSHIRSVALCWVCACVCVRVCVFCCFFFTISLVQLMCTFSFV